MNLLKNKSIVPLDLKIPLGLKYAPVGPDNAPGGSPFLSNVRLTPGTDGESFQSFPGSRYTLPDLLWDQSPVNEHRIMEYSPSEAFNIHFGRGLQVVDGKLGWVGQGAFYDGGENWPVDDAAEQFGPAENFHESTTLVSGAAWTDATGGNVTCSSSNFGHRLTGNYSKFVISNSATAGTLAYFNVAGTFTAAHNAVALWIYFDSSQLILPGSTLYLSLCSGTNGSGSTVSAIIRRPIHAGLWLNINEAMGNQGIDFSFQSIVLGLNVTPTGFYTSSSLTIRIDNFAIGYTKKLNRMGPWDFPYATNVQGRAIFGGSFCNPAVFDGVMRGMGIPDPRFKPTVTISTTTTTSTTITNLADLEDASDWETGSRVEKFEVTGASEVPPLPVPGRGPNYLSFRVHPPRKGGDKLCWTNPGSPITIPGTANPTNPTTSVGVWLRYKGADAILPRNTLRLAFATTEDLGAADAERFELRISVDLPPRTWVRVEIPWTKSEDYTAESIGFIMNQPVNDSVLNEDGKFYFAVDDIDAISFTTTTGAQGSTTAGNYQFCFTWYDSVRDRESNPSPLSDLIPIGANQAPNLDLSGYLAEYCGLTTADGANPTNNIATPNLPNSNPDPWFVDSVRIYVHKEEWVDDQTGDAIFKRAATLPIPDRGVVKGLANVGTGGVSRYAVLDPAILETWTLLATSATEFSVTGSTSGASTAATVGTFYDNGVIQFLLTAGATVFSVGDSFVLNIIPTLIVRVGNWLDEDEIFERGETLSYNNGYPPSCEVAVIDKDRLILAGQKDYSNGTITIANGSYVLSADSGSGTGGDTPLFGRWACDRQVTIEGDPNLYDVYEVIPDTPGVGRLDGSKLFIGKDFDAFTQTYKTPYQGASGSGLRYTIHGNSRSVYVSANTGARGPYPEGFPSENEILLDMPGDQIVGAGLVGDYLAVFGRRYVYVALQNTSALNDAETVFPPYLNPRLVKGAPGLVGKRAIASIPGGKIIYITPEFKIAEGTADGFAVNVGLTNNVLNLFKDGVYLDADSVSRCHAIYVPEVNQTLFFMVGVV